MMRRRMSGFGGFAGKVGRCNDEPHRGAVRKWVAKRQFLRRGARVHSRIKRGTAFVCLGFWRG